MPHLARDTKAPDAWPRVNSEFAEGLYTNEWRKFIFDKYGTLPSVTCFECPVIVDNITGEIITDDC
jgi:hypothetical protein